MEQTSSSPEVLPSFSIILETENLANADIEGLSKSLASLMNQDIPPSYAREVLIIDSGDIPMDLLEQLCDLYPWITVYPAPASTGYYKAKMLGAQLVSGEIIVYCDSDCLYESHWLRTILTTFAQRADIQVVAGETATRGVGPYGTAMALTYIFPQYSGDAALTPTPQYFLNNVAFRREFLLSHPIPVDLPLYRGNCVIHARNLRRQNFVIWKQPHARATHAPPNGLSHFFWRFLLIGHDYYWQEQLLKQAESRGNLGAAQPAVRDLSVSGLRTKTRIFFERVGKMIQNDRRHLFYLPLALPAAIASILLILFGYLITALKPHYLLQTYDQILSDI